MFNLFYQLYTNLAIKYGTDEAILIDVFKKYNKRYVDKEKYENGEFYMQFELLRKLCPFWNKERLLETLKSLFEQGVLKKKDKSFCLIDDEVDFLC